MCSRSYVEIWQTHPLHQRPSQNVYMLLWQAPYSLQNFWSQQLGTESHTSPLNFQFPALLKIIWIEYEQTTALELLLSLLPRTKEKGEELRYAFVSPGVCFQPRALYNKKQAKMFPSKKTSELRGVFYFNEAILGFMVSVSSVSKTPTTLKRSLFVCLFTSLFTDWDLVIKTILTLIFSSYWNSLNIKQICGVITGVTRTKDRKISVYMSQQFGMGY